VGINQGCSDIFTWENKVPPDIINKKIRSLINPDLITYTKIVLIFIYVAYKNQ
jgi:hypothetical protein